MASMGGDSPYSTSPKHLVCAGQGRSLIDCTEEVLIAERREQNTYNHIVQASVTCHNYTFAIIVRTTVVVAFTCFVTRENQNIKRP